MGLEYVAQPVRPGVSIPVAQATHLSPLLLTVPEAAAKLRIGRNTAYRLVRSGALRSVRIGHLLRVPLRAVDEFIAALEGEHAPA